MASRIRHRGRALRPIATGLALLTIGTLSGCSMLKLSSGPANPKLTAAAQQKDMLALSDALEGLIDDGTATGNDRAYAYEVVKTNPADTAATAYARAAITGRLVQDQGLRAAQLVPDVEEYALRSRKMDPKFRDGAATILVGKLYVMAPATLLKHGDSETGLELLEEVTTEYPDVAGNHLRLAEAYITLHDPEPAGPHLCYCLEHKDSLRPDDQRGLKDLLDDAGPLPCDQPATP